MTVKNTRLPTTHGGEEYKNCSFFDSSVLYEKKKKNCMEQVLLRAKLLKIQLAYFLLEEFGKKILFGEKMNGRFQWNGILNAWHK